jgi:Mn-dependent DtxR family transcriptional regulator
MLNNNEECNWSVFLEKPLEISLATLSKYMNILKKKGFIEKMSKGIYKITLKGKRRFFDLRYKDSFSKDLKYPPDLIYKKRNYKHIILWMLYNNESCKWADFMEKPLSINSHSLSKNINHLIKEELIKVEQSDYQITQLGENEYLKIIKIYNLDYQSILEEELKKVERIKGNLEKFFNKWNVQNDEVKILFLDLLNKLDYIKVKEIISSEEEYHKILLYLALNNLIRYPEYISIEEFSENYQIDLTTLNFFLQKIIEEDLFDYKIFNLEIDKLQKYYFKADEKIDKMIQLIIDDDIKKYSFLNLMELTKSIEKSQIESIQIFKKIINDISENLFNKNLKEYLITFLHQYISYLYDILKRTIPSNLDEKFKMLVFENIANLKEYDLAEVREELYQLMPILSDFPKYKILEEMRKKYNI